MTAAATQEQMLATALAELMRCGGLDPARAAEVCFTGADPVLPTRYRIGTVGAAALAGLGLALTGLREQQTGKRPTVAVDVRDAVAALRRTTYIRIDGQPGAKESNLSGFYRTKDRWIYFHCNQPIHQVRLREVLVQSASGLAHTSAVDGVPRVLPVSGLDYLAGYLMAYAALVALQRRARGQQLGSARLAGARLRVAHLVRAAGARSAGCAERGGGRASCRTAGRSAHAAGACAPPAAAGALLGGSIEHAAAMDAGCNERDAGVATVATCRPMRIAAAAQRIAPDEPITPRPRRRRRC